MKAKVLSLVILLGFGLSCSTDSELGTEPTSFKTEVLPHEDWYSKMGLDFIARNEVLPSIVKEVITRNDYLDFAIAYAYETYHYSNGVISHMITSKNDADEFLIVSYTPEYKFNLLIMKVSDQVVTYIKNGKILAKLDLKRKTSSLKTMVEYPGDCDELGPLREYEVFTECLTRNLENFCCDFVGCAALVLPTTATAVAAAATISCTGIFEE